MSDIARYESPGLPDTMEDLARFLLIAPEKATALRAEIRAIEKVGLAKAVYDQKLEETNTHLPKRQCCPLAKNQKRQPSRSSDSPPNRLNASRRWPTTKTLWKEKKQSHGKRDGCPRAPTSSTWQRSERPECKGRSRPTQGGCWHRLGMKTVSVQCWL